ncbi:Chromosome Segregation Family protein [Giardia duodenalis]|uniref:Uncharacterized protein n=2 Tax=Giardia intestinalis TaxID=5741 RepID=C6LNJ3_GIAIB|nr:Hypothetical protein GL50581_297 [Giardia intestinalis ATCC 50581]ESU42128.1 Chromosome Segregation Family protein [Giardia intestinalis]
MSAAQQGSAAPQPVSIVESIVVDENGKKKKIIRKVYAKKPGTETSGAQQVSVPGTKGDPLSHSMIANATEEDIARIAQSLIDRLDAPSAPGTPNRTTMQPPRNTTSRSGSRQNNRMNSMMADRQENSFMRSQADASGFYEDPVTVTQPSRKSPSPPPVTAKSPSAAGGSTPSKSPRGSQVVSQLGGKSPTSHRSPAASYRDTSIRNQSMRDHSVRMNESMTRDRLDESTRGSISGRPRSRGDVSMRTKQRSTSATPNLGGQGTMRSTSRGGAVGAPQTPGRSRYDESEMFTTMTANDQDMVNRLRIQLMNERKMTEKYKKDLDLLTNREELENMRYQINDLRKQLKEKDHELSLLKKASVSKERAFKQAFDADANGQTSIDRLRNELQGAETLITGLRREKQALQEKNDEMERRERRLLKVLPTVYYRITGQQNGNSEDPATLIELVYNQFNSMAIDLRDSLLARDKLHQKVDSLTSELQRCGKDLEVAVKSIENNRRRSDGEVSKYKETIYDLENRIMGFAKEYENLLKQYKSNVSSGDAVLNALNTGDFSMMNSQADAYTS